MKTKKIKNIQIRNLDRIADIIDSINDSLNGLTFYEAIGILELCKIPIINEFLEHSYNEK